MAHGVYVRTAVITPSGISAVVLVGVILVYCCHALVSVYFITTTAVGSIHVRAVFDRIADSDSRFSRSAGDRDRVCFFFRSPRFSLLNRDRNIEDVYLLAQITPYRFFCIRLSVVLLVKAYKQNIPGMFIFTVLL